MEITNFFGGYRLKKHFKVSLFAVNILLVLLSKATQVEFNIASYGIYFKTFVLCCKII